MKKAKEIKKEIETAKTQVEKNISKFPKLPKINFKLPFVGKKENNKFDLKKVTSSKEFKFVVILLAAFVLGFISKKYFIAATVNGQVITRFQVIKELEKKQGKSALESIVTQTLIEQEAKAKNATVTAEEIATELKTIEDQISTQGENLDELLAAQGMTRTQLTDQIRLQKLVEKLLGDRLNVTDDEVNRFIEDKIENKIADLLLTNDYNENYNFKVDENLEIN